MLKRVVCLLSYNMSQEKVKFPAGGCIQKLQNDALFVMKEQRGARIVTMMNMMAR